MKSPDYSRKSIADAQDWTLFILVEEGIQPSTDFMESSSIITFKSPRKQTKSSTHVSSKQSTKQEDARQVVQS